MKFSTRTLFLLLLFLSGYQGFAQCATDQYARDLAGSDSALKAFYMQMRLDEIEGEMEYRGVNKTDPVKIISVVFHVIHTYGPENISKAQIDDQMRILNEDFRRQNPDTSNTRAVFKNRATDMNIEFRLARRDPNGNCTEGITRHYSTLTDKGDNPVKEAFPAWNNKRYLNIWVVRNITYSASDGYTVLGFAFPPDWLSNTGTNPHDGIMIRADRVGSIEIAVGQGRTLTHEVGHWLGLWHPFQGGCTMGDGVADTPPVDKASQGCNLSINSCTNDSPDEPDMVENYMDYSNDACKNAFTEGQRARVYAYINLTAADRRSRKPVTDSSNHAFTGIHTNPDCGPIADFHTEELNTLSCQGTGIIKFLDDTYNGEVVSRKWIFEGGTPAESTEENPTVQYMDPGLFRVTLIVSNGDGADTLVRENFITILPSIAERKAPFGENFEAGNIPVGWRFEEADGHGWSISNRGYSSSKSAVCTIDENTPLSKPYSLTIPPVDILGHGAPLNLSFRLAYRSAGSVSEVMLIQASTDCGATWSTVKGMTAGNGLASVGGTQAGWSPVNATDWSDQVVSLNKYATNRNLMVRFYVISKQGNSVYIDNINLGQFRLSAGDLLMDQVISFYPNPAEDVINIDFAGDQAAILEIKDLSGRAVKSGEILRGTNTIGVADLTPGMYILQMRFNGYLWTRKLIIN